MQAFEAGDHAGVYACCPYIAGQYHPPLPELTSWVEKGDYMMNEVMGKLTATAYDPTGEHAKNPLAWPYHAAPDELTGLPRRLGQRTGPAAGRGPDLPPHVVSVNELDPLRDEGLIYARKLMAAGVPTQSRTVNGTAHGGDTVNPQVTPEAYYATIRDVHGFAASL